MRRIITTSLLLIGVMQCIAAVVSGRVEEHENGGGIPGVTLSFSKEGVQSVFYSGEDGTFKFSLDVGRYQLTASREGYKERTITVDVKDSGINYIVLQMAPDFHELGEVVVTGRRYLTKFYQGSFVYQLSKDDRAKGKNLFSALNLVPLISTSPSGEVEVKGSGAYHVYMNGRPFSLSESNVFSVLSSLKADKVEAVEVVTDPSLKYGIADAIPIINIIINKQLFDGLYNTVNISGTTQPKAHGQEMLLASKDKVKFSFTYDYDFNGQRNQKMSTKTAYLQGIDSGASSESFSENGNDGNLQRHTLRGIFEWSIDSIRNLYVDTHAKIEKNDYITDQHQKWVSPSSELLEWDTEMINKNTAGYVEANIKFEQFFRSKPNIRNYYLGYRYSYNPDHRHLRSTVISPNVDRWQTESKTSGGMNQHSFRYYHLLMPNKMHYIHWSLGANLRIGNTHSSGYEPADMRYHQDVYNATLGYTGVILERCNLIAQLKGEYSRFDMNSQAVSSRYNRNRFSLLPHFRMIYYHSASISYDLTASSSVRRPTVVMLNPFEALYNPLSAWQGNPNLKDEKDYTLSMSGNYFTQKLFVSLGFDGGIKKDFLTIYYFLNDEKASVVGSYANVSSSKSLGANYFIQYNPSGLLTLDVSGIFNRTWLKDTSLRLKQKSWDYHLNASINFIFPHNWMLAAKYGRHKGPPEAFCENSAFNMYSLSAQKSFFKGSFTVGLTINNAFGKFNHSIHRINTPVVSSTTHRDIRIGAVGLNLIYTFHKGDKVKLERSKMLIPTDLDSGVR